MAAAPGWILIGHPAHRRVERFQAALAAAGRPPAHVVAWRDVLARGAAAALAGLPAGAMFVRIDAAGQDAEVERALVRRGRAARAAEGGAVLDDAAVAAIPDERGRILAPRQHHLGFAAVLAELAVGFAARPAWRVLQPPAAIADLFDKRVTSRRYRALGVPVPDALDDAHDVRDPDTLRAAMDARGWRQVFVKLASGSSASGLAVVTRTASGEHAMTTVEQRGAARYNTRRIRRSTGADLEGLLGWLLAEGAHVERAVAKARLGGRIFDCRVLVVAGEPAFLVVRTSTHPITNLHLGGRQGDPDALRAACPPGALEAALASCRQVHAAHGTFHTGIDVLFEPGLRHHRVIEANAFGDLLNGVTRDGLDVYGWQIRAAHALVG